nr:nucleotidyltransferase MB21D2 [Anolis sagrei ordinatus]
MAAPARSGRAASSSCSSSSSSSSSSTSSSSCVAGMPAGGSPSPCSHANANAPSSSSPPSASELDFRSGARLPDLTRLIQELARHESRDFGDQRALEIHTAKDFVFSMLGMVQKLDQKLPVANEYLLLSGGVREGVVDLDLDELSIYARGTDYDMDFTLLVPALKLHDRNQPVTLDMRHSALCHSWLSLRLFDEGTISKWKDCCTIVDHINGATNYFFSPTKVAEWFYDSISIVLSEIQKKPQRGMPKVEKVEKNGTIISIILGVGSSRMLYDIVPVVSFKGWPAVAQSWLMENHFWDGKITEEEVISGFYLVPACSHKGRKDNEWRLSFARSEVQLKKCISASLMQAYQACKAIIIKLLSRPKAISPYHLRSMMLWACDRLPANYLAQEDYAAHFLLGLIDDLQHCLVNKMCPNYFIPQCNMLEHLSEETVMLHARKLSSVRSDPAEHLQTAIEHVKAANRLTLELQRRGSAGGIPSPQSDGGDGSGQPDDRLAKKLQQLVTENPGKSISVFINPDDVTRPHFRIDDKFF